RHRGRDVRRARRRAPGRVGRARAPGPRAAAAAGARAHPGLADPGAGGAVARADGGALPRPAPALPAEATRLGRPGLIGPRKQDTGTRFGFWVRPIPPVTKPKRLLPNALLVTYLRIAF